MHALDLDGITHAPLEDLIVQLKQCRENLSLLEREVESPDYEGRGSEVWLAQRAFYDRFLEAVVRRSDYPVLLLGEVDLLFRKVFRQVPFANQLPLF